MNCFGGEADRWKALKTIINNNKLIILNNFTKFTGNYLCQSLFFNKVAGLMSATLLKKRLWHRCFPEHFAKILRILFLQNTSGRLLPKRYFQRGPLPEVFTIGNVQREQGLYLHRIRVLIWLKEVVQ